MLFDLRGRGRRRTVRIIYIGLALLMGVGLVGFGVGGGFGGGGILSGLSKGENEGGGASYSSQIKKYRKLTQEQPSNASAWENLTKALLHEGGNEAYTTSAGAVTSKGKELFHEAAQAWSGYIALNPPKPNAELAQLMETVYGESGLNEPAKEVEVLQIAVVARPTDAALYAALAEYAYKAHNVRVGRPGLRKGGRPRPGRGKDAPQGRAGRSQEQPIRRKDVHDHDERQNLRGQAELQRRSERDRSQDDDDTGREVVEHQDEIVRKVSAWRGDRRIRAVSHRAPAVRRRPRATRPAC